MHMANSAFSNLFRIKTFLIITGAYLLALLILIVLLGYNQSFLVLNAGHQPWLDWPMFFITHLGDSLILTSIISLIFIKKKPGTVLVVIVVVILTGLIGQILKETLFDGWDRPLRVFNESPVVYVLPNYRLFHNSFPSGHSITAMAAFTALIWSIKPGSVYQLLAAFAAIIITYSRIYLGAHFPGDVLAGSLIGIMFALLLTPYIEKMAAKINFGKEFRRIISVIAVFSLFLGAWLLRDYFAWI